MPGVQLLRSVNCGPNLSRRDVEKVNTLLNDYYVNSYDRIRIFAERLPVCSPCAQICHWILTSRSSRPMNSSWRKLKMVG